MCHCLLDRMSSLSHLRGVSFLLGKCRIARTEHVSEGYADNISPHDLSMTRHISLSEKFIRTFSSHEIQTEIAFRVRLTFIFEWKSHFKEMKQMCASCSSRINVEQTRHGQRQRKARSISLSVMILKVYTHSMRGPSESARLWNTLLVSKEPSS